MNPSVPPTPESPGRKTNIPDKSSPTRQKQQQAEGVPSNSKTVGDQDKQQQRREPERVATEASTASTSSATTGNATSNASGENNGDVVGEYVLGETIGKGTFGKVKLGLHLPTGEKVAVKILEKKRIVLAADVERVAREIKILKRNRHQNVIQLYEVIDSPDRIFLIMEHIDGGEMFEYIVAHHRIREPEAAFLFRQIVEGLAYLHSNEVTHRDLKPENLLLQSNRHNATDPSTLLVKIVDFGLSNTHDGGRLLRTACGSPCYAAPEMIQGRLYRGPIADMWSLGVVLFAMVCGFLPFEDSNTNMLYKKILSANYKMPTFLSANVQDLIRRILETDPEKRYTVDKILQHPWLAGVQKPDISGYDVGGGANSDELKTRHKLVLSQLESLGLPGDEVQSALSKNLFNRVTASYYLLDSKLQRIMRNRAIPVPTPGNTSNVVTDRAARRESNRQQDSTVRTGGSDVSSAATGTSKRIEVSGKPLRQNSGSHGVQESPRRRSNPHHPPQHQQHSETQKASSLRVVTPANAPPHASGSGSTQRPSSVRGGRNLVMISNSSAVSSGSGFLPIAPNPPRDHRHSGVLTARKPQSNSRVTVSNGMVALRPLVQPAHPPRREFPPSTATRRHSNEVAAPPYRSIHDPIPAHPPSHHSIISSNGVVVVRRRGPVPPPPHAGHTHSPHQSHVVATPAISASHSASKADDTRSPQRLSTNS
ncbi:Protein kinase domain [Phytophthora infestans]|nr:Protein kinase domain [Phytophthora infestans]KAF4149017.1 Protein kinase domain [Phytophthora infestans]